jgi:acyl carrier protein
MEEKLRQVFAEELGVPVDRVTDDLRYGEAPEWDSIAHMALVAAIETAFDIMIDAEQVIDMSSFAHARRLVERHALV